MTPRGPPPLPPLLPPPRSSNPLPPSPPLPGRADKWQKAQAQGLFLSEDEARFFFKVLLLWYCCWVLLLGAASRGNRLSSRPPGSCSWRRGGGPQPARPWTPCTANATCPRRLWPSLAVPAPPACPRPPPPHPHPQQFLGAVKYCHAHCVAHRDLKLDNTLLDGADPPSLKVRCARCVGLVMGRGCEAARVWR